MPTACSILDAHWDGKLPVNVAHLATAQGILVERADLAELAWAGYLNGRPVIRVSPQLSGTALRYLLAHAVGHFALGHLAPESLEGLTETSANFKAEGASLSERQAHEFAGELLMPQAVLDYAIARKGYTTLGPLAQLFGVSEVAMRARLTQAGVGR